MFRVLVDDDFGLDRDTLVEHLRRSGIDSRPSLVPLHQLPPYTSGPRCPVAEGLARRGLLLPPGTKRAEAGIGEVCRLIESTARGRA